MIFKYGLRIFCVILFFSSNINKCIYIPSEISISLGSKNENPIGRSILDKILNILNQFLYLSRISNYYNQSKIGICSLSNGPNCFFSENKYVNYYLLTKNENSKYDINNDWVEYYSKIQKNDLKTILQNLSEKTLSYINFYSNKKDSIQNPPNEKLNIIMTFDDNTTYKGQYLTILTNTFYNERLIADFTGKLRLADNADLKEKEGKNKDYNYPSKLYGVIESESVSISFRGKIFICNSFYIKAHDEEIKLEEMRIFGNLGEKVVFGYSFTDNSKREQYWQKIIFPELSAIDKLVIYRPYDIDNISFTFHYEIYVNEKVLYYMYNDKKIEKLVIFYISYF